MILVFLHCGQIIISNMEFLFSWVTNLYICIAQPENIPIKSCSNMESHTVQKRWNRFVPVDYGQSNWFGLNLLIKDIQFKQKVGSAQSLPKMKVSFFWMSKTMFKRALNNWFWTWWCQKWPKIIKICISGEMRPEFELGDKYFFFVTSLSFLGRILFEK